MVSKLLKLLNKDVTTMNQAALVLAIFSLLSQLCGLVRDHLLASRVGPSEMLDVYYAAFRVPDFIYTSVASLFSVTVIIPFLTKYIHQSQTGEKNTLKHFADSVFSVYMFGMIIVCVIAFICMPYLTRLIAPGFEISQQRELITFSRIMLLSPFLLGLSSLLGSFAQVQKKFFSFAIAPLFYNLGILLGILLFLPIFGMKGVVLGVVLGATMYLLIQIPTLHALQRFPALTKTIDWKLIREVVTTSLPRTFALSITNMIVIVMASIASFFEPGSISIFQFSYNIETTPLMIIGISYAVAAFPTLSRLFAEKQRKEFADLIYRAARNIFFLSIPASVLFIVLRAQIVRVLLGAGQFSWNDTRLVAASVALFSISITAQCMILLLVRGFYASSNTKTPLKINAIAALITISSALVLLYIFNNNIFVKDFIESLLRIQDVPGSQIIILPLAFSCGQIASAIMLWVRFHARIKGHTEDTRDLGKAFFHTLAAGIVAGAAAYGMLQLIGTGVDQSTYVGVMIQGALSALTGIAVYSALLLLLKNEDIILFTKTLQTKFWKQKPLTPEQADL